MLCAGFEDSPSELIPKNFFIKCIDIDGLWKLKCFSSYFLFFFKLDLFDRWIYRGNFIRNSEREFKSQRYLPPELYACVQRCVQLFVTQGLWAIRLLCPWNFPGKNTGLGCHFLLQGDLPDPGIKSMSLCHLQWQADFLLLNHWGSPLWMRSLIKKHELILKQLEEHDRVWGVSEQWCFARYPLKGAAFRGKRAHFGDSS